MALYDYNLVLMRKDGSGELLPEIYRLGLLDPVSGDEAVLFGRVNTVVREAVNRLDPDHPLRIVTLAPDTEQFEQVLQRDAQSFVSWFWQLVTETNVAYAYITPESYAAYYKEGGISSGAIATQLGRLLETGKVEIVHPVMFFSERLGQGKTCDLAEEAPFYTFTRREGVGCLLMFIDGDPQGDQIEILDPGTLYGQMQHHFQRKMK